MPAGPVFRLARAVIFAVVCVTLATAGHAMASRTAVPVVAVVAGLLLLTGTAVVLAGSERSLATILGGLLCGQFVLHVLFAAAQHGQHAAYGRHAQHLAYGHAVTASSGGATMVLSHAVAATVAAWWLRRGERATWRSARTLARRAAGTVLRPVAALLAGPPRPPLRSRPVIDVAPANTPTGVVALRHVRMRRGPPSPPTTLA
jgi:hypothetical protein